MSKKHKHISAMKTTEQKAVQQSQQPQELTPQKLNRLLEKNPFAQLLGMELLEVREGYAYGRMRMDEHFTNIYGGMHGGCAYALADTLAGLAASTYGNYVTTIDGKMNYLEAVKDTGYVYGEAEVQRQGGRIGVYTVKLKKFWLQPILPITGQDRRLTSRDRGFSRCLIWKKSDAFFLFTCLSR